MVDPRPPTPDPEHIPGTEQVSYDYRISIIVSFILILLTLSAGLSVFMVMQRRTKQIITKSLLQSLKNHIQLFELGIKRSNNASWRIASRSSIIKTLKYLNRYPTNLSAISAVQQSADTFSPTVFSLVQFTALNRHIVASAGTLVSPSQLTVSLNLPVSTHLLLANGAFLLMQKLPMLDTKHKRVGWLTTEARLPALTQLIKETGGLGKTEEFVICRKLPTAMQCFPDVLRRGRVFRNFPLKFNNYTLPMVYALGGGTGLITTRDYRKQQVFAAYAPIGDLGLVAVLKVDTKELYAPIYEQISYVIYALVFVLAIGLLLLYWLVNPLIRKLAFSEHSVRDSEVRTRTILENINEGLITTFETGTIQSINPMAERLLGYAPGELIGQNMLDVISPDSHPKYRDKVQQYVTRDQSAIPTRFELCILRCGDHEFSAEICISDMLLRGQHKFIITLQDITQRKKTEAKVLRLATYDLLTGLPNRSLLEDRIKREIQVSQRNHKRFAVVYIDLNDFKSINDSLGHDVGDALLKVVAKRLSNCLRGTDTVARQGGDEFIIILSDTAHVDDASIAAQKILDTLEKIYLIKGHELHSGANLGIAHYPDDGQDGITLLKNSDTAMYKAKSLGRHNYCFYSPEMATNATDCLIMRNNLHHAIDHNELTLHYQPIVSIVSGEMLAVEALLRWTHPVMGSVSPARFIPVAENSGLILSIGEWVLETACRQIRTWEAEGISIGHTVVNLSPLQFRQADLVKRFTRIIKDTGIDPNRLGMEITESVIMEDPDTSIRMLNEFKAMGIEFSLDDFGTGYSSLSYLKRFPVDNLKIDRSFVCNLMNDRSDEALVEAIIAMANKLKIRVIAEGVETEQQLDFLRQLHCDQYQGYYYSHPLPAHELQLKILR